MNSTQRQTSNIPTDEIYKLVEFSYSADHGRWEVKNVQGYVTGDVKGDVYGNVYGTINGMPWDCGPARLFDFYRIIVIRWARIGG